MRQESEVELIARAKVGDEDAWTTLVELYDARLRGLLRRLTWSTHDAEDLVQDTWMRVKQKFGLFDGLSPFRSWLFTVARNHAVATLRRQRLVRHFGEGEADEQLGREPDPLVSLERKELRQIVRDCIARLPDEQRTAIWMKIFEGRTFQQIGESLDVPWQTVASRVRLALEKLRTMLKAYGQTHEI